MSTETTRTPRENQAKACSEVRLRPNSDGRERSVDCGLGRPEQICLWIRGRVKHGGGQHRRLHEQGEPERAHGQVEAADAQRREPDEHRYEGGGEAGHREQHDRGAGPNRCGRRCRRRRPPGRTGPATPGPTNPVSTVSDRAMTPKMQIWDMRNEWPTPTKRGRSGGQHQGEPDAGRAHLSCAVRRRFVRKAAVPMAHDDRSPTRAPFCREAARTRRATWSRTKRMSSTVAGPLEGLVMFHCSTS